LIDLHCHVLPGVDDGAADMADSIAMGRQADADGIAMICATPHIRHDHSVPIDELAGRVQAVNREYERAGLGVRVVPGGEVSEEDARTLPVDELEQLALGGGRWILVEPAPGPLSETLLETAARLSWLGFGSLIAHPERHLDAQAPDLLARLAQAGALVQLTAQYLADGHPAAVNDLAERGLVHVLGSDSHSARIGRPVRLSQGYERLAAIGALARHIDWITHRAPQAIVSGGTVKPPFRSR
jgi:protein-tyrosine phosphatase